MESKVIPGLTCLLYLGFHNLYAVYEIDHQMVGVNLIFKRAALVSKLEQAMPSPEDYKARKKATREAKPKAMTDSGYYTLDMFYYWTIGNEHCGPCSGVSIGRYYRNECGYGGLPGPDQMYVDLNYTMGYPTFPAYYGPGFVEMTGWYDYNNFSYDRDPWATEGDYWNVVDGINHEPHGWPTAIMGPNFKYLPGHEPHWIAIRGYEYPYPGYEHEHAIICTDSATKTSYLHLDWDNLSYGICETVIIKD